MNFVFNQGGSTAGSHQTEDVTGVSKTSFFEVASQTNKYTVKDVTDTYLPYISAVVGDVTGDKEVNIDDINAIINIIFAGSGNAMADVNGDGEINIIDVNAVIDIILNQ